MLYNKLHCMARRIPILSIRRLLSAAAIWSVVVGHLAGCARAQTSTSEARVKVTDEVFDFGFMPQRSFVSHVFWLKNPGGKLLEITKLVPNCGCTEAPLEKSKVAPGDSARVQIIFGSSVFHGALKKFTQIESNAGGRVPALTFTAQIVTDSEPTGSLRLTPRRIDIETVSFQTSGEARELKIGMKNVSNASLQVALVDRPDRVVTVENVASRLVPGEERSFILRFDPKAISPSLATSLTFQVEGADTTRLTLPIFMGSHPERPDTTGHSKSAR